MSSRNRMLKNVVESKPGCSVTALCTTYVLYFETARMMTFAGREKCKAGLGINCRYDSLIRLTISGKVAAYLCLITEYYVVT